MFLRIFQEEEFRIKKTEMINIVTTRSKQIKMRKKTIF